MRAWWFVFVVGCWSTPAPVQPIEPPRAEEPPPPTASFRSKPKGPSHCERSVDHVMAVMQPQIDASGLQAKSQLLRDAVVEGCLVTSWAEDTLACYDGIASASDITGCHAQLTDVQRRDLDQRMSDVIRQP